jgi:putative transposase
LDWGHIAGSHTPVNRQSAFLSGREVARDRIAAAIRAARIKAKNGRRRHNFHHQVSATLINRFGLIATEKLQIATMTRSAKGTVEGPGKNVKRLNREILDTAPARFLKFLSYKAAEAGAIYLQAPTKKLNLRRPVPLAGRFERRAWTSVGTIARVGMTSLAMPRRFVPV